MSEMNRGRSGGGGAAGKAGEKGQRRAGGGGGGFRRRRVCKFRSEHIDYIDYKDVKLLMQFIPERGKILPRRISGVCTAHQRMLTEAIKRARNIALLPYTAD